MLSPKVTIGLNGSMLDEHPTGVGVYSLNLINCFSRLSSDSDSSITVFTPTNSFLNKNLKIVKLPKLLLSSKYGKAAAFCRFFWNTFIYPIQASKFDYLISPTTHGSFLLNNQIITIHDLLSLRFNNISPHQRFYYKFLLPHLASKAKIIIAISETTKKDIIHFLKCPEEKIQVIHNGYDENVYFPIDENCKVILNEYGFENYFLAVGPTYAHKNFEKLIAAYNNLSSIERQRNPLVIAGGKYPYLNVLKQLVAKLKLEEHVHFLGYVPDSFMPSLYREAFALIFPSLYEGFGMPPLEAMACGCPVITSNTSSLPEVCGDAVLYINPAEESSITAAMRALTNDNPFYKKLIVKGLLQAKKFSWNKTAQALKTLLDNKNSINTYQYD